jgi:hypothetical protein
MDGSRRLGKAAMVVVLALAWVTLAAPGMAGSVSNSSGSNMTAQVVWGTGDENGGGHFGGIYGGVESSGTYVGLWEQDAQVVPCDNGTPGDTSDDFMGYVGIMTNGDGTGSVTISPNLQTARVTGVLTITTMGVDYCAGNYGVVIATREDVPVSLDLRSTSNPMPWVDVSSDRLAHIYNMHQNVHGMSRDAAGTAMLGGEPYAFDSGLISHNHWTGHDNSH